MCGQMTRDTAWIQWLVNVSERERYSIWWVTERRAECVPQQPPITKSTWIILISRTLDAQDLRKLRGIGAHSEDDQIVEAAVSIPKGCRDMQSSCAAGVDAIQTSKVAAACMKHSTEMWRKRLGRVPCFAWGVLPRQDRSIQYREDIS